GQLPIEPGSDRARRPLTSTTEALNTDQHSCSADQRHQGPRFWNGKKPEIHMVCRVKWNGLPLLPSIKRLACCSDKDRNNNDQRSHSADSECWCARDLQGVFAVE